MSEVKKQHDEFLRNHRSKMEELRKPLHAAVKNMGSKSRALKEAKESPRMKFVKEANEKNRISNMTPVWKDRHERRHGRGKRTSLSERLASMREMGSQG